MTFSPKQIADLESPLSRDAVKGRKQAGREVNYIESWHAESEANRIFGFDGWDSLILDLRLVSEREVTIGKGGQYEKPGWSVSYVCTVRVPVWNGERFVTRDGVGAGHGIDADLGQAHESAVKEAASDAEKRGLKTFGNQFGLALYDKTQANVADTPSAEDTAKAMLLAASADQGLFKESWLKNKDAWKRLLPADSYARVVKVMQDCAAKFPKAEDPETNPFRGGVSGGVAGSDADRQAVQ